jgi:multiple sugar transport system permease protein/fructooligosaccharide transport system permease protein
MKSALGWITSIGLAMVFLAPISWMVCASFLPDDQIFTRGFFGVVSPGEWTLDNYDDAWRRGALARGFVNSALQIGIIVSLGLFVSSTAAFAFARLRFRGRDFIFAGVVALIILPLEVLALPLLLTVADLGLTGGRASTIAALSLPFAAKAFNIYFLRQHFLAIPDELEEAASIDGASAWRFYWSIALPAIRPALTTVVLLDVLTHWSDFIWPLMVASRSDTQTVQLGLAALFTQPPIAWGDVLACAVTITAPIVVLFQVLQRKLVITDLGAGIR